jgi:hypothetical protein
MTDSPHILDTNQHACTEKGLKENLPGIKRVKGTTQV